MVWRGIVVIDHCNGRISLVISHYIEGMGGDWSL